MTLISDEIKKLNIDKMDFNDLEYIRNLIILLLNVIESQPQNIEELRKENQSLKDEINRLKGEKGKPKFLPNVPEKEESPPSQTAEKKKNWTKSAKKPRIKIDRTEYKYVDKSILPPDAEYKGYRTIIVQNIKFATDNVEYKLELAKLGLFLHRLLSGHEGFFPVQNQQQDPGKLRICAWPSF